MTQFLPTSPKMTHCALIATRVVLPLWHMACILYKPWTPMEFHQMDQMFHLWLCYIHWNIMSVMVPMVNSLSLDLLGQWVYRDWMNNHSRVREVYPGDCLRNKGFMGAPLNGLHQISHLLPTFNGNVVSFKSYWQFMWQLQVVCLHYSTCSVSFQQYVKSGNMVWAELSSDLEVLNVGH